MPKVKERILWWLLVAGLVLISTSSFFMLSTQSGAPAPPQELPPTSVLRNIAQVILSALGTTLIVAAALELIPEYFRRRDEKGRRDRFFEFFGEAAKSGPVLVMSGRDDPPDHGTRAKSDLPPEAAGAVPEGVRGWLALDDIRTATRLAQEFGKYIEPEAAIEEDVVLFEDGRLKEAFHGKTCIAIGLGFNTLTRCLEKWEIDGIRHETFSIRWEASKKKPEEYPVTDNFILTGRNAPAPPDGMDEALILRLVPRRDASNVMFICAGRTAPGTEAAGRFLAGNWPTLHKEYKSRNFSFSEDSMAVLLHFNDGSGKETFEKPGAARDLTVQRPIQFTPIPPSKDSV